LSIENNRIGTVIVGLGSTGLSCAKYFMSISREFRVVDTRLAPPGLEQLLALKPNVDLALGPFSDSVFDGAQELVVSPGVSLSTPEIRNAVNQGVKITGDIDIFSKQVGRPIVGVTGSNGKSTVVAVLAEICKEAGLSFAAGGNLDGEQFKPALDLLLEPRKDLYILELSSFQLETTESLNAQVATLLNLSEDHMDRYDSFDAYWLAKQRIFVGCKQALVNIDDSKSQPKAPHALSILAFGLSEPSSESLGIRKENGLEYLEYGDQRIACVDELKVVGQHNIANVLAAAGLAITLGINLAAIRKAVTGFSGLPHRCQWAGVKRGVSFYNDSKGTNVGATVAAIEGLGKKTQGKIVLIAGGVGKGADFKPLAETIKRWVKTSILIGQDAKAMAAKLDVESDIRFASTLEDAVKMAIEISESGDAVLLSPACASFDMFDNFQHRGFAFMDAVRNLH
jgi:UDP-N-acetylmuramoylalanine--D-glutamate ligase